MDNTVYNIMENTTDAITDTVNDTTTDTTTDTVNDTTTDTTTDATTDTTTKQQKILEINRDTSLTKEEKLKNINQIMLGIFTNIEKYIVPECDHYKKSCGNFYFTCCNKTYDCCRCHNEHSICNGPINISNILCKNCNTKQIPSNSCINCNKKFGRSYCNICNIWSEKNITHCDKCEICRVGNSDQLFHCDNCNCCYHTEHQDDHTCIYINKTDNCVSCLDSASQSQQKFTMLKCKHFIHVNCMHEMLKTGNYKCPACKKSMVDMTMHWRLMDIQIASTPLPDELIKKVNIICYDCEQLTNSVDFHIFGMKCGSCDGYNTSTA